MTELEEAIAILATWAHLHKDDPLAHAMNFVRDALAAKTAEYADLQQDIASLDFNLRQQLAAKTAECETWRSEAIVRQHELDEARASYCKAADERTGWRTNAEQIRVDADIIAARLQQDLARERQRAEAAERATANWMTAHGKAYGDWLKASERAEAAERQRDEALAAMSADTADVVLALAVNRSSVARLEAQLALVREILKPDTYTPYGELIRAARLAAEKDD